MVVVFEVLRGFFWTMVRLDEVDASEVRRGKVK